MQRLAALNFILGDLGQQAKNLSLRFGQMAWASVHDAKRSDHAMPAPPHREAGVHPDMWAAGNQRMMVEARIVAGIFHNKWRGGPDDLIANGECATDFARIQTLGRFGHLRVGVQEADQCDRGAEHFGCECRKPVKPMLWNRGHQSAVSQRDQSLGAIGRRRKIERVQWSHDGQRLNQTGWSGRSRGVLPGQARTRPLSGRATAGFGPTPEILSVGGRLRGGGGRVTDARGALRDGRRFT